MPQELLDGTAKRVVTGFEEVGRKAVAQGVGTHRFEDARQAGCLFDRLLQAAFVQVVAVCDGGTRGLAQRCASHQVTLGNSSIIHRLRFRNLRL